MPAGSQSWGWFPLHWPAPGMQAEQLPALQKEAQAAPWSFHIPTVLHCCGCRPLQPRVPGTQVPEHTARLHA
jgi:hypothetical protein